MNVNLLAISVNNTRTRFGTFVDGKLFLSVAIDNKHPGQFLDAIEKGYHPLRDLQDVGVVVGSVNAAVTQRVMSDIHKALGDVQIFRIEQELPVPIGRQLDPEAIVGEDRLLNAAAAYDAIKQACIIVDAGTALKVDFVDGQGTFHGGAIAPGAQMMLDSLHTGTAQLPEIRFDAPTEAVGHNTTQAMLTGVFHGMRGMVRELVEQYAQTAGIYPLVIATGGNAEVLFKDFDMIDRVVPDLALWGIAVTWHYASQDSDGENTSDFDLDRDDESPRHSHAHDDEDDENEEADEHEGPDAEEDDEKEDE